MKYVFRFIGFLVVVLLIAALALYTLNSFGYLHGPLSKWINDVANHCQGTVNDTVDFAVFACDFFNSVFNRYFVSDVHLYIRYL